MARTCTILHPICLLPLDGLGPPPAHSGCMGSLKFHTSIYAALRRPSVARRWLWLAGSVQAAATTPCRLGTQQMADTTCGNKPGGQQDQGLTPQTFEVCALVPTTSLLCTCTIPLLLLALAGIGWGRSQCDTLLSHSLYISCTQTHTHLVLAVGQVSEALRLRQPPALLMGPATTTAACMSMLAAAATATATAAASSIPSGAASAAAASACCQPLHLLLR